MVWIVDVLICPKSPFVSPKKTRDTKIKVEKVQTCLIENILFKIYESKWRQWRKLTNLKKIYYLAFEEWANGGGRGGVVAG